METFAEMARLIMSWIKEEPNVVIHSPILPPVQGLQMYRSKLYIGFEAGHLDICRHLPREFKEFV